MLRPPAFDTLRTRLAEIEDLRRAAALLEWDRETMMPPAAADGRGEQLATLHRLAHELFVSTETERLLEELRPWEDSLDPDSDEASLLRVTRRDYEKAVRVPGELRAELSREGTRGLQLWVAAKRDADFASFLPALERLVELRRRYVACFEPASEPYDVLLDNYDDGLRTATIDPIFARLRERLPRLLERATDEDEEPAFLRGPFPVERQREVCRELVATLGLRPDAWRLDETVHPFAENGGPDDIRLTTYFREQDLDWLFATVHEFGHGLYDHGVDRALARSPLGTELSLALHESQSRTWENLVGRSLPFWRFLFPKLRETFPETLDGVSVEEFHRGVNRVRPSLIRIRADEVSYDLHVILRYELERELIAERLEPRDLPAAWNERVERYLGLEVPNDAEGVLQDSHWADGTIGYFPTYSLGNVIAGQLWQRLRDDVPDLDERLERGDFAPLRDWLREQVHRHGRKRTAAEVVERIAGAPIDPEPYLAYLERKYGDGA